MASTSTRFGTGKKNLRIDLLPEDVREKILALARQSTAMGGLGYPTIQQVDRTLRSLDANALGAGVTDDTGWARTNDAMALGRLALRYFAENPTAKTQFRNYIGRLQSTGRLIDRGANATKKKKNGVETENVSA